MEDRRYDQIADCFHASLGDIPSFVLPAKMLTFTAPSTSDASKELSGLRDTHATDISQHRRQPFMRSDARGLAKPRLLSNRRLRAGKAKPGLSAAHHARSEHKRSSVPVTDQSHIEFGVEPQKEGSIVYKDLL